MRRRFSDLRQAAIEQLETDPGYTQVIKEQSLAGESQSDGATENVVKVCKGVLRILLCQLEEHIEGKTPTAHCLMAWLVEHVSMVL